MNSKLFFMAALLGLGLISVPGAWAATCGNFTLNAGAGSTGSVSCTTSSGNIHFVGSDVRQDPGGIKLFSGVTDLSGSVSGIFNNAPRVGGFGAFSIASNVWDKWDSIYIALKQGNGYGLFLLTATINSGKWKTAPGNGTGLSHYLAFGGKPSDVSEVPVPAAVWLFGSALAGLVGTARRKSKTAIPA